MSLNDHLEFTRQEGDLTEATAADLAQPDSLALLRALEDKKARAQVGLANRRRLEHERRARIQRVAESPELVQERAWQIAEAIACPPDDGGEE